MKLVQVSFSAIIAGLILSIPALADKIPLWSATLEQQAISRLIWFIVIAALIFLVMRKYVGGVGGGAGRMGRTVKLVALAISALLVFLVFAVQTIGLDTLIKLPKTVLDYAHLWYAIPAAIAIHLIVLFLIER